MSKFSRTDYKEAFNLLLRKQGLLDSIYDINKAKEIANMQVVYELNKSNEQIAELKASELRKCEKEEHYYYHRLFPWGQRAHNASFI